jgi:hypothetical protein
MTTLDGVVIFEIIVTALITDLLLLVGHWFRWDLWLGKKLPRIAAYVYGLLSILGPVTVLLIFWQMWIVVWLLWICAISGGVVVIFAYLADDYAILKKKDSIAGIEREILYGEITKERK